MNERIQETSLKRLRSDYNALGAILNDSIIDRQVVCSKSGIILERIFEELGIHYRCSIPRNRDNIYTLDALYNSVKKLFGKLQLSKTSVESAKSAPMIEQIDVLEDYQNLKKFKIVRNVIGAHFNLDEEDYSDLDVREFAETTLRLANAFHCNKCGALPFREFRQEGGYKCDCTSNPLRMLPQSL